MKLADDYPWQEDYAYISLLKRFSVPRQPNKVIVYGNDRLKEPLIDAIQRLISSGALEECNLAKKADTFLYAADFKDILRDKGYTTSGTKSELLRRVLEVDKTKLEDRLKDKHLLIYSSEGEKILLEFQKKQTDELKKVQDSIFNAFVCKDIKSALRLYKLYRTEYGPENGNESVGFFGEFYIEQIEKYLGEPPPRLYKKYGEENICSIQSALGMTCLWRRNAVWDFLPVDFPIKQDEITVIQVLIDRYTKFRHDVDFRGSTGYLRIMYNVNDPEICDKCQEKNGKVYAVKDLLDWPFEGCQNELGCLPNLLHSIHSGKEESSSSRTSLEITRSTTESVNSDLKNDKQGAVLYVDAKKFQEFILAFRNLIKGTYGALTIEPHGGEESETQRLEHKILDDVLEQIEEENSLNRLRQLHQMLEENLISTEEYDHKKQEILSRF